MHRMKYREIIADKLSKVGWSLGWVSAIDSEGRTLWIVDAHRDNGKRFVVRSDEMLRAFVELERITHELTVSALLRDDSDGNRGTKFRRACQLAVFSDKLPAMEAEIDCSLQSNSR